MLRCDIGGGSVGGRRGGVDEGLDLLCSVKFTMEVAPNNNSSKRNNTTIKAAGVDLNLFNKERGVLREKGSITISVFLLFK